MSDFVEVFFSFAYQFFEAIGLILDDRDKGNFGALTAFIFRVYISRAAAKSVVGIGTPDFLTNA
ncbi:TPA: hypothetical protein ACJIKV_003856 [Citrobacter freundii]